MIAAFRGLSRSSMLRRGPPRPFRASSTKNCVTAPKRHANCTMAFLIIQYVPEQITEAELETAVDGAIAMFRMLSEKVAAQIEGRDGSKLCWQDVFEKYYKIHLARRLLADKNTSEEQEASIVSKLKVQLRVVNKHVYAYDMAFRRCVALNSRPASRACCGMSGSVQRPATCFAAIWPNVSSMSASTFTSPC